MKAQVRGSPLTASESGSRLVRFPQPFGKYTLISHLATGGMAYVFLARQQGPAGFEKECVIKRILPHLGENQDFVAMFLDEARIAARLSHPNIVQIFDLGQVDQNYFLAMEYVNGRNLNQILRRAQESGAKGLPWPIATRIVADAAGGLAHAHQATDSFGNSLQLVHRDLSPANIMVSWAGVAKVLDFGIASAAAKDSHTVVGTLKGRVHYMSPEQLQGHAIDARSDLFSLGVVFYELLYGEKPFPAENMGLVSLQILQEEAKPPENISKNLPAGLRLILSRALSKRPEDRWQHARAFQRALEQLLLEQKSDCTAYHVEAYLNELFPKESQASTQVLTAQEAPLVPSSDQDTSKTQDVLSEEDVPNLPRISVQISPSNFQVEPLPKRSSWFFWLLGGFLCVALGGGAYAVWRYLPHSQQASKLPPVEPTIQNSPSIQPVTPAATDSIAADTLPVSTSDTGSKKRKKKESSDEMATPLEPKKSPSTPKTEVAPAQKAEVPKPPEEPAKPAESPQEPAILPAAEEPKPTAPSLVPPPIPMPKPKEDIPKEEPKPSAASQKSPDETKTPAE